jgi:hypothetical protein
MAVCSVFRSTPMDTNAGMAISKLLGFDLCPRLRNLSERRLYVPRRFANPEGLPDKRGRHAGRQLSRAGGQRPPTNPFINKRTLIDTMT